MAGAGQVLWVLILAVVSRTDAAEARINETLDLTGNDKLAEAKDYELITPEEGYVVVKDAEPNLLQAVLYTNIGQELTDSSITIKSSKPNFFRVQQHTVPITVAACSPQTADGDDMATVNAPDFDDTEPNANTTREEFGSVTLEDGRPETNTTRRCYDIKFYAIASELGYCKLTFALTPNSTSDLPIEKFTDDRARSDVVEIGEVLVTIQRLWRPVDQIFQISLTVMVCLSMFAMGTDVNLDTVKEHLRTPKAPLIALFSQYTFMPFLSFGVIYAAGLKGGQAMGVFLLGVSPGGGTSNMLSKLLNGDVSVSATMTLLSTVASLGMLPFWIYTLGTLVPENEEVGKINIPYVQIVINLAQMLGPLAAGVILAKIFPKVAKPIRKCLKALFLVGIIYSFTFGVYVNLYVYEAFNPILIFGTAIHPYGGFLCGGLLAYAFRFDWKLIKTIALETGFQNAAVAMMIMYSALKSPDSDLAVIAPIAVLFMTIVPFLIITPIYLIRQKFFMPKNEKEDPTTDEDCRESSADSQVEVNSNEDNPKKEKSNSRGTTPTVCQDNMAYEDEAKT